MEIKKLFEDLETLREIIVSYVLAQEGRQGKIKELESIKKLVDSDSFFITIIKNQDIKALEKFPAAKEIIEFAEKNTLTIYEEVKTILVYLRKEYYYIFFK